MLFQLGNCVQTKAIAERIAKDAAFEFFVLSSFKRHMIGDWGNLDVEDKASNDEAVKTGHRLLSQYELSDKEDDKIWIITEWDRSVTTVLYPSEY
jgi:hypothetical protein